MTNQSVKTRTIISVGVLSALAFIATVFFHFRISFLAFDLKDAVMAVSAIIFGPVYGAATVVIVSLVEALTIGSTGVYGFIMNVISSLAFVLVGSAIYRSKRTLPFAILAMLSSTVAMTAVMLAANLVITPYYMHVSADAVVKMIPTLLLPFNVIKAVFNSALVFIIYKPIANALRLAKIIEPSADTKSTKRSVVIAVSAAVVGAVALVIFFAVLSGTFTFA